MAYKKINTAENRVEIYFDGKPSAEIRDYLKSNHFRWYPYSKCWYCYKTDHTISVADKALEMVSKKTTCGNTSSKTTYTTFKNNTTTPQSGPKTEEFNNGQSVLFEQDGQIRYGEIFAIITPSMIGIGYYESYKNMWGEYKTVFVNPAQTTILPTTYKRFDHVPSPGSVVEYEDEDSKIKTGIIDRTDSLGNAVIKNFTIDKSGKISKNEIVNVRTGRILEQRYYTSSNDLIHLSIGDKVEFYSILSFGIRKGIVTAIEKTYTFLYVTYKENTPTGSKEVEELTCIENVTKLNKKEKLIERSDFITDEHQRNIEYNESIKKRIKTKDDLFSDSSAVHSRKPLYRHQLAGSLLADKYNKFAFFYDTGTGKTVMALNIVEKKYEQEKINFLIIAPKSIIKTAWVDDATNFYPEIRLLPLYSGFNLHKKNALYKTWITGTAPTITLSNKVVAAHAKLLSETLKFRKRRIFNNKEIDEKLQNLAQHYIINPEMFIQKPEYYIEKYNISGIIMDESAILKNYDSKTSKVMRKICEPMKYVYLLSGKPAPNNEIEFFSQMKIVAPEIFDFSYGTFLSTFCYTSEHKYMLSELSKEIFSEMVSAKSLIVSKKDCLDLPETTDIVRLVELPEDIMADYDELYYECMVLIKGMDDSTVFYSTQSRMAVLMKLRQMASGFFIETKGHRSENRLIVDIHKAKIHEVKSIIEEIPEEQIIIWCQFQHEIELLEKELSKYGTVVTAYGKTKTLEDNIDAFKNGRAKYIIAHPKTLKYGVTFTNCHYTIYYSFSYSAEDYDQSHDRNYRLGQTQPCTYFYIQAEDTIDEIMYNKVMHKLSNAEFFEQLVKDATKHGIDYDSLKGKSDEEIKQAMQEDNSAFSEIQDRIVENSEERDRIYSTKPKAHEKQAQSNYIRTIRVNDNIEPTYAELLKIENSDNFGISAIPEYHPEWYSESLPHTIHYSEGDDINSILAQIPPFSYPAIPDDEFAFLHPHISSGYFRRPTNIMYEEISLIKNNDPERYIKTIENSPTIDIEICDMLRQVFKVLEWLPKDVADTVCLYYGLMDGKPKLYSWFHEATGSFYDANLDYHYDISRYPSSAILDAQELIKRHKYKFFDYEELMKKLV